MMSMRATSLCAYLADGDLPLVRVRRMIAFRAGLRRIADQVERGLNQLFWIRHQFGNARDRSRVSEQDRGVFGIHQTADVLQYLVDIDAAFSGK